MLVYAFRVLRNAPAFTAIAVITLALAIGANTAMFTVIRAVLLAPLPYRDSDRLVDISGGATPTRFEEMRAAARSFDGLAAYTMQENLVLSGGAEPEVLRDIRISANFLSLLGIDPLLGRGFRADEDTAGGASVALISTPLWERRFAADPHIVGKIAVLSGTTCTIIGVLPRAFRFPSPDIDVWLTAPTEGPASSAASRRLSPVLTVFGRLKPGVTFEQADAELRVIRRQYAIAHPAMLDAKPKAPRELTSMKDNLVAHVRSMLWMLFGAVGLVLLISCANIAGLLLARSSGRAREFALRRTSVRSCPFAWTLRSSTAERSARWSCARRLRSGEAAKRISFFAMPK